MTREEAAHRLDNAAAALGEHFTAVQILASWPVEDGGTAGLAIGRGDWYARVGLAHEFVGRDQAQTEVQTFLEAQVDGSAEPGE